MVNFFRPDNGIFFPGPELEDKSRVLPSVVNKFGAGSEVGTVQFSRQNTGENCQKNTITDYSVCSKQTAIPSIPSILLSGAEFD